ncbi:peptide ABC transporter [Desulfoluna limicola]|uniref:Peptide ABC transporter n=1 Tax=Desulfoluna limicola TaxID=2810562 RepID=A0ABM7PIE5_9BACT|nr:ATP-binding cassette domain-containing protein [Desulfoluna limicola]BCS97013.1 peptide ABC transporter [Desulfoluna limicola]
MLDAWNIHYRYPKSERESVSGVSLHVRHGETVGIFGPSGCGKSTFARLLAGFLVPDSGRVTLGGDPLPQKGRLSVQLLFQHPELTVNPRWRAGKILAEGGDPLPEILDALGILPSWHRRYPHELSGGEIQRLAIARALHPGTQFLIADEMSAMIDAITQAALWHAVKNHQERHQMGLVVISHDLGLLSKLCDRIIDFPEGVALACCDEGADYGGRREGCESVPSVARVAKPL